MRLKLACGFNPQVQRFIKIIYTPSIYKKPFFYSKKLILLIHRTNEKKYAFC